MKRINKKLALLIVAAALAVGCVSCGSNGGSAGYSQVPTQKVIVEHKNAPSWNDVMTMNQRQQMLDMMRTEQFNRNMDATMDRMRGTMDKFGRTVDSANRMRQRSNRRGWSP